MEILKIVPMQAKKRVRSKIFDQRACRARYSETFSTLTVFSEC